MLLKRIFTMSQLAVSGIFSAAAREPKVGGQAIIEGVMMRGKGKVSLAVKKPNGEIVVELIPFVSLVRKYPILKKPVVRGFISLIESLVIGIIALSRSAELADEAVQKSTPENKTKAVAMNISSIALAFFITFGLFLYLPLKILSFFIPQESALLYNALAGVIRVLFFLTYLYLISLWKDIQRIFEFHGAEHKAIFTFEEGKELTLENMRPYTTYHPRCGTSFLLLVALICIFIFAIIDALIIHFIGPYPNVLIRTLTHIALIPIVSGTSYEILRLSDRYRRSTIVHWLIQPGLWLQHITTREPNDEQLDIASQALKAVL
jgi:uncharacterized protein YqhQ